MSPLADAAQLILSRDPDARSEDAGIRSLLSAAESRELLFVEDFMDATLTLSVSSSELADGLKLRIETR